MAYLEAAHQNNRPQPRKLEQTNTRAAGLLQIVSPSRRESPHDPSPIWRGIEGKDLPLRDKHLEMPAEILHPRPHAVPAMPAVPAVRTTARQRRTARRTRKRQLEGEASSPVARHITPGTGTDKRCRQAPTGDFSALPVASLMSPQPAEGQHPAANAAAGDQSASEQVGGDQSAAAAQAAASHEIQDATVQQTDARDVLQLGDQTAEADLQSAGAQPAGRSILVSPVEDPPHEAVLCGQILPADAYLSPNLGLISQQHLGMSACAGLPPNLHPEAFAESPLGALTDRAFEAFANSPSEVVTDSHPMAFADNPHQASADRPLSGTVSGSPPRTEQQHATLSAAPAAWADDTNTGSAVKPDDCMLAACHNADVVHGIHAEDKTSVLSRAASAMKASAVTSSATTASATAASAVRCSATATSAVTCSATAASATVTSTTTASAPTASAMTASANVTSATTGPTFTAETARLRDADRAAPTVRMAGVCHMATANLDAIASSYSTAQHPEGALAAPAPAATEAAPGLSMCWEEFVTCYLPQCTSDFYASQGWELNKQLHPDQIAMVEAFQREVFQMINYALLQAP